jgi:hypothetical protein
LPIPLTRAKGGFASLWKTLATANGGLMPQWFSAGWVAEMATCQSILSCPNASEGVRSMNFAVFELPLNCL